MDTEGVARLLGVSIPLVRKWTKLGKIPYVRFSHKAVRFRSEDIDAFVKAHIGLPTVRGAKKRTGASP